MSHWYDTDGVPRYEVESKDGNLRPTTLRDARKYGWVPSVSTVWKDVVNMSPNIVKWSQDILLDVLITNPKWSYDNESESEYKKRVLKLHAIESTRARDQGTKIHGILEESFKTGAIEEGYDELVKGTKDALFMVCGEQEWKTEHSFAHPLGYGGQIDLYSDEWVVDFKTKDQLEDGKKPSIFDSYGVQLSAYDHGVGGGRKLLNLFISVSSKGYVYPHVWEEKDRLFKMFSTALDLWKLIKKYEP